MLVKIHSESNTASGNTRKLDLDRKDLSATEFFGTLFIHGEKLEWTGDASRGGEWRSITRNLVLKLNPDDIGFIITSAYQHGLLPKAVDTEIAEQIARLTEFYESVQAAISKAQTSIPSKPDDSDVETN